jgi:hypothetical protein
VSLPASIDDSVERIREVVKQLRGHLNGARHSAMPESCIRELTGASLRLAAISTECNAIQANMAAGRATGQAEWKSVPVEALELHPVNLRPEPQEELKYLEGPLPDDRMRKINDALIRSLHRAGDHTLDEDEPIDRNVAISPEEGDADV